MDNASSPTTVAVFLDGKLDESRNDDTVAVVNPANGRQLFTIPAGCDEDVDRAVAAARHAFEAGSWSAAPPSFRKRVLHRLADLIAREAARLDALDAEEMGKPIGIAFASAAAAAELARFYAEALDKISGDVFSSDSTSFVTQRRVPFGVVAAIVPWNFPTFTAVLKIAPALAAGNSVVLKPSEWSSRSAIRLAELAIQAGLPPGVLNVVPGTGERVGRALALHHDVDIVAFTGSTAVGRLMQQYAGQSNMKVVMAECGGKSPQIVFADGVDLEAASLAIAQSILTNQGQVCGAGSRLLVQRGIEQQMLERVAAHMREVVMGDPLDPKTSFGPLVSAKHATRVMSYIESARHDGARVLCGGERALPESGGSFVAPTLLAALPPHASVLREEIFGPVLSAIAFEDEADAIRIANGTPYGLTAYVWTAHLSTGLRMAKGVRSTVFVNAAAPRGEGAGFAFSAEPFGQSGIGAECGLAGLESYLRRQLIWFNHA